MPAPENPKVGGCYIWFISFLLFVFTISGAVFLLLYVTQPASKATTLFACIGVTLVFLPWVFWLLTFFYRVISRCCGFRMICFGPYGSGYPNNSSRSDNNNDIGDKNGPVMSSVVVNNLDDVAVVPVVQDGTVNGNGDGDGGGDDNGDGGNGGDLENGETEQTGPRRVRFGGVVIIGETDDANPVEHEGSPEVLSRSSSSSSSVSRHSHDSETPLRLSMA